MWPDVENPDITIFAKIEIDPHNIYSIAIELGSHEIISFSDPAVLLLVTHPKKLMGVVAACMAYGSGH